MSEATPHRGDTTYTVFDVSCAPGSIEHVRLRAGRHPDQSSLSWVAVHELEVTYHSPKRYHSPYTHIMGT